MPETTTTASRIESFATITPSPTVEQRLAAIEMRSQAVAANKAWETSWTRRALIAALTYAFIVVYLSVVIRINPWLNAVVPTTGFLLSTLTLQVARDVWVRRRTSRRRS